MKMKSLLDSVLWKWGGFIPDKLYLSVRYYLKFNKLINWDNPKNFCEKLQWLKLYNRKPEYTMLVDKVKVKNYVATLIGEEYIIPTIGVWDNPNDIDFDKLPNQFVLKCNHNSGLGMCICRDKEKLDVGDVRRKLRKGLKQNYYLTGREWPYKNVERKILGEKFMTDGSNTDLNDYKFYCFNGEPLIVMISSGRYSGDLRFDYYNMNWEKLSLTWDRPNSNIEHIKPVCFDEMKKICQILSSKIPHVRVDLYVINSKPYFGEMTFFDSSGFCYFEEEKWNNQLGQYIELNT